MALAAANHCTICNAPCDIGTGICPWCKGKAVNFAGGLYTHLDYVSANVGFFLNALEHLDWADCLHLVIGPFKAAAVLSPYLKTRVKAWQGRNHEKHLRIVTVENRAGWGVGAWGPIRGLSNFWPGTMKVARGSDAKLIGSKDTASGTIYAFEQSFAAGWSGESILAFGGDSSYWVYHHRNIFEKKLTRGQWERLYDSIGRLDFPLQQNVDAKASLLENVNGMPSLHINGFKYDF